MGKKTIKIAYKAKPKNQSQDVSSFPAVVTRFHSYNTEVVLFLAVLEILSYLWDIICSIFSGARKFRLIHGLRQLICDVKSVVRILNFRSDVTYALPRKGRKENHQKLTQLSSRSHPRHLVGKRTAQKDTIIDTTSDSQVNSNFPNMWSPASLTFNNYFYLFLYLYIT